MAMSRISLPQPLVSLEMDTSKALGTQPSSCLYMGFSKG